MKMKISFISFGCALAMIAGSVLANAQEKPQIILVPDQTGGAILGPPRPPNRIPLGSPMQAPDRMIQFASAEMGFDNKVVLNAAFSGEITCENIQTLSDGNRIVNRSTITIYRDGLGRTRREQVFNPPGQPAGGPNERRIIYISDVVGGNSYTLDPNTRTATKNIVGSFRFSDPATGARGAGSSFGLPVPEMGAGKQMRVSNGALAGSATRRVQPSYPPAAKEAKVQGSVQVSVSINENGEVVAAEAVSGHELLREAAVEAAKQWQFKPTTLENQQVKVQGLLTFNFTLQGNGGETGQVANVMSPALPSSSVIPMFDIGGGRIKYETRTESLGTQMVEGIAAEGTRYISTIPAGAIGNERQIDIVRERWYSPELQLVILMKHVDPRIGESTQRLTNIDRSEPDTSLFSVDGYEIKEGFGPKFLQERLENIRKRRQENNDQ
jgi:TonB family protein